MKSAHRLGRCDAGPPGLTRYGPSALLPGYGKTRGRSFSTCEPLALAILDAYAHQTAYTVSQIHRRVVRPFCRKCGHAECAAPSVSSVRRLVEKRCPNDVRVMAREGTRAWQEQVEARVLRDLESAGVNGWWVSDHRRADNFVLVPDGQGAGWPSGCRKMFCPCGSGLPRAECCSVRRPWWTVTCDVASAAFVGWRVSLQPNAATVAHSLRSAILRFGVPQHWLRDNGKEFTANRLGGKPIRGTVQDPKLADVSGQSRWPAAVTPELLRTTVWEQLGVDVHTSIKFYSWSKLIEGIFGAWVRLGYERELPGWCGSNPGQRPDEMLKRQLEAGELLPIDRYVEILGGEQVNEWNSEHCVGRRKKPPLGFYEGYVPCRVDPQTLNFLLSDRARQTIRHGRIILEANGREHVYMAEGLAGYAGVPVDIVWDRTEAEWIYVYPPDGTCLAVREADHAQYGEFGEPNLLARRVARAQRRHVREWAARIKGACPPELMDPWGAHREAAERAQAAKAQPVQPAVKQLAQAQAKAKALAQAVPEPEDEGPYADYVRRLEARLGHGTAVEPEERPAPTASVRPDGERPLARLAWDLRTVVEVVQAGARTAVDSLAAACWARAVLSTTTGRGLLREAEDAEKDALADYRTGTPTLTAVAARAADRDGAVSAAVVALNSLAVESLSRAGLPWHRAVAAVREQANGVGRVWRATGRFAGLAREDLHLLHHLGFWKVCGLDLQSILNGLEVHHAGQTNTAQSA